MSLTSYRAAPPRDRAPSGVMALEFPFGKGCMRHCDGFWICCVLHVARASMPGDDLLFHRLSDSTIGAVGFHGRVRNGIGWDTDAIATRQWSRCDMRLRSYLGPSGFAFRRSLRVLKSIPCMVRSQRLGTPSAGVVVFDQSLDGEGIGNLASS